MPGVKPSWAERLFTSVTTLSADEGAASTTLVALLYVPAVTATWFVPPLAGDHEPASEVS